MAYDHVCKGIISTDDGCERAQPAMGSTIPRQLGLSYESRKPTVREKTGCQAEFLRVLLQFLPRCLSQVPSVTHCDLEV